MLKEGSATIEGYTYQNIIGADTPCHRDRSDFRGVRVTEVVDVKNKNILDLGCNIGTMSQEMLNMGANSVVGVDYDSEAIGTGRKHYPEVTFMESDINIDLIKRMPHKDIVVWTSQFMWMVKQHGWDYAKETLRLISTKCDVLVFETAGADDGSAPLDIMQTDVMKLLIQNTTFQDIVDTGPWTDALENWNARNVFVCKKPFKIHHSSLSLVTIKDGVVTKDYRISRCKPDFTKEVRDRETMFLKRLQGWQHVPMLIEEDEWSFKMSYEGMRVKWIPDNQFNDILHMLRSNNITHRDIKPDNLLWNGDNVVLIDWSWAIFDGETTNYSHDLGGNYKCPLGFNDEYSLRRVQREI